MISTVQTSHLFIFNDREYAGIRKDLHEFVTKYSDIMKCMNIFSSFQKCHSFFQTTTRDHKPTYEKIVKWKPTHPETQSLKECLLRIYHYAQSEEKKIIFVLTNSMLVETLLARHREVERDARFFIEERQKLAKSLQSEVFTRNFCGVLQHEVPRIRSEIDEINKQIENCRWELATGAQLVALQERII